MCYGKVGWEGFSGSKAVVSFFLNGKVFVLRSCQTVQYSTSCTVLAVLYCTVVGSHKTYAKSSSRLTSKLMDLKLIQIESP